MIKWPTPADVEDADIEQLCRWYRFLPSASDEEEVEIINKLTARYHELGGMTPEISKKIGW